MMKENKGIMKKLFSKNFSFAAYQRKWWVLFFTFLKGDLVLRLVSINS